MPASQDSSPLPEVFDFKVSVKVTKSGEQVYIVTPKSTLWPNQARISVSFLDGTDAQKSLVKAAFAEYAAYANTNVVYVDDGSTDANIRISFEGEKVWSALGTQSLQIEESATISLGSISKTNPADSDFAVALHHVGRALGLTDEQVNGGDDSSNEAVVSSSEPVSAEEKRDAAPKTQLTDADKAWLTLHYPGRVAAKWTTLHALDVLDVPLDVGSKILSSEQLSGQRAHYANHILSKSSKAEGAKNDALTGIASKFVSTANAKVQIGGYFGEVLEGEGPGPVVETQADIDIQNIIGNCYREPWFRRTIANITKSDLKQRGIPVKEEPEGAQNGLVFANGVETQQGIWDLVPIASKILFGSGIQAQAGISADTGYYPGQPLSPELQQGVFDVFTKVLKNPIFTEVVKKAVQAI